MCKADLQSEMVGEFPELQGLMGRYYAQAAGHDDGVPEACEEHYKPLGPGDAVPSAPVSVAVALADKIDTLTGFWAIDEKPTGSKDPYALRRAALGGLFGWFWGMGCGCRFHPPLTNTKSILTARQALSGLGSQMRKLKGSP